MINTPVKNQIVYVYTLRDKNRVKTDNYRLVTGVLTNIKKVTLKNGDRVTSFKVFVILWDDRIVPIKYNEKTEFIFSTKKEAQNYIKDKLQTEEFGLLKRVDEIKKEITLLNKQIVDVMEWDGKKS